MSDRADERLLGTAFFGSCVGLPAITALGWALGVGIERALGLGSWRNPLWLVTIVFGFVMGPAIGAWLAIAARKGSRAFETGMFLLLTWGAISGLTSSVLVFVMKNPARKPVSLIGVVLALALSVTVARWLALRRGEPHQRPRI